MPIFALEIKANLVGVTDLRPEDYENFRWYLKLKCTQCGEVTENWVYADITEAQELSKGHGIGHIVGKCSFCARQNTVEILTDSYKSYSVEKNEQFQPIVRFECRGAEPVDFDFRVGWRAEGIESSTVFEDIDLNEKDGYGNQRFLAAECVGERRAEGKASSHSCENLLKEPSDVYICKNCSSDEMVGYGSLYSTNPFSSTRLEVAGTKECEEALLRIELQLTEFRGALERLAAMMKTIEEKLKFCSALTAPLPKMIFQSL
ncbi:hypothetical protein QR680_004924 [Steinernema hermaphroditum]|uniref:CXXC motif containing zinc binding protein n=1 Tax=Steinernema hermaphroditum TaxID=289476 RepID=A0AA39HRP9_9BILA|nr:hypothetical protein QR680_004924 [Steinernema hermaphroditum]